MTMKRKECRAQSEERSRHTNILRVQTRGSYGREMQRSWSVGDALWSGVNFAVCSCSRDWLNLKLRGRVMRSGKHAVATVTGKMIAQPPESSSLHNSDATACSPNPLTVQHCRASRSCIVFR